jgi:hypothetical protein
MNLISDMQKFLLSLTAVSNPITTFLPGKTITDQEVLQRVVFDVGGQDLSSGPYLVYSGPFNYDTGLFSGGACGTKKANFFVTVYDAFPDSAYQWATNIEQALIDKFPNTAPLYYYTGPLGTRFVSWLQVPGSMRCLPQDQTGMTGKENPRTGYTQAFQVGWQ